MLSTKGNTNYYRKNEWKFKQNNILTDRPDGGSSTETIGMNSITCITFDKPLLKWNGDVKASQGIWTKNFGVDIQMNCGLSGDCGRFRVPSKIEMPYFKNNDFFDLSEASGSSVEEALAAGLCSSATATV